MELKGNEQRIARVAVKAGREIPDRVLRAVNVWPHLEHYDRAFRKLDAGRFWISNMAGAYPVRIAETEKWHYAHGRGLVIEPGEYERFVFFIDRLDDEFITWQAKHRKDSTNADDAADDSDTDDTEE